MAGPIERHSAQLNVNAHTTLQDLKQFTDQAGGNQKLRGVANSDGSITLYATDRKASQFAKLSGKAAERSQLGRDAVSMVMRNVATKQPDTLLNVSQAVKLVHADTARSTKTDTLSQMMGLLPTVHPDCPRLDELPKNLSQSLQLVSNQIRHEIRQGAGDVLQTQNVRQAIQSMAIDLKNALSDPQIAKSFPDVALSEGSFLRQQITEFLHNDLGVNKSSSLPEGTLETISARVFDEAAGFLTGVRFTNPDTLDIGGKTYVRGNDLGKGAFGKVVDFTPADGKGPSVAVKFMNSADNDNAEIATVRNEALKEFGAHKRAEGTGHPNILGNKGIARIEGGGMALIIEKAPMGDLNKMMGVIKDLVVKQVLTPDQGRMAQMTLIKDMTSGLNHMHNSTNTVHIDFKPPNVFINSDGIAKIADFGTGKAGNDTSYEDFAPIGSPFWQSPEVLQGKTLAGDVKFNNKDLQTSVSASLQPLPTDFQKDKALLRSVVNDVKANANDTAFQRANIDAKAYDSWALGVTAYNLFFEDQFQPKGRSEFLSEIEVDIKAFAQSGVAPIGNHANALHQTTGDAQVDDFINKLMIGDPQNRMTTAAAMQHPALQGPQLGSAEVRTLIAAIGSGDLNQIQQAVQNLP